MHKAFFKIVFIPPLSLRDMSVVCGLLLISNLAVVYCYFTILPFPPQNRLAESVFKKIIYIAFELTFFRPAGRLHLAFAKLSSSAHVIESSIFLAPQCLKALTFCALNATFFHAYLRCTFLFTFQ